MVALCAECTPPTKVERQSAVDEDPQIIVAGEREMLTATIRERGVDLGREAEVSIRFTGPWSAVRLSVSVCSA
jgi:hypothetical protein